MTTKALSIGEFSRMSHLTAKALRFYHRVGLLEPDSVDPLNGYRKYSLAQLPTALFIHRFRSLDVPVGLIREVMAAADPDTGSDLIAMHVDRLELRLVQLRSAVSSLRTPSLS